MSKRVNIGLFGFGVVGHGLYDILRTHPNFQSEIVKIGVKDRNKKRDLPDHYFTFDKSEIINNPDIDLIVEVISDADEAYSIVSEALKKGKNVVTANKKMLAEHLSELLVLQEITGGSLLYEASACGSIPIVRNLEEYFDNEPIRSISGIFNGSSNYILTKIFDEGQSYESALEQAQKLGFAEADPTLDVGGFDALNKLVILTTHAFGTILKPQEVFNAGIQHLQAADIAYAKSKHQKIKLLAYSGQSPNGQLLPLVIPVLVNSDSELYHVNNEYNAVLVDAKFSGLQLLKGKGAGGHPTGSAVLSDISANYYQYKYEYKKREWAEPVHYRQQHELDVYLRYASEANLVKLGVYDITEKNDDYVIGKVNLADLIAHQDLFQKENLFIAVDLVSFGNQQKKEERLFAQV